MSVFDPMQIRRAFERAAPTYEAHAALQRDVAAQCLAALLDHCKQPRGPVLDAGAGPGHIALHTQGRGLDWNLIALDVAPRMCALAARFRQAAVVGDIMRLPFSDSAFAAVVSSLALQWIDKPAQALRELARVTRPRGWGVIATFGPATLRELASAFEAVDRDPRVTPLVAKPVLEELVSCSDWQIEGTADEIRTQYYGSLAELMTSLKAIGATDRRRVRRRGLTTPGVFRCAESRYRAAHAGLHGLPATWQVYYLVLRKPG
jgi:malonyl-CoA O-methyltransferase